MNKLFGHFKTVVTHKFYVLLNCIDAGIAWQGIKHDLSKFSLTEFLESVNYYTGVRSPIEVCKEENGYSRAWLHHRGRNPHHHVYWVDNLDEGGEPIRMPYKYALEQICDFLGAGKAYLKDNFSYEKEYEWWVNRRTHPFALHPDIILFTEVVMYTMCEEDSNDVLKRERSYPIYLLCCEDR